jgi:hypothetical protein
MASVFCDLFPTCLQHVADERQVMDFYEHFAKFYLLLEI